MLLFILLTVLIASAVACVLWWTLTRAGRRVPANDDSAEWAVMVARRREIDEDASLDPALRATLIEEWQSQAAAQRSDPPSTAPTRITVHSAWIPAAVVLIAGSVYAFIGNPNEPAMKLAFRGFSTPSVLIREAPPKAGENHPGGQGSIEERIAALEAKLKEQPDNLEGWVILARSRGLQRNYPEAVKALEQALRLAPGHPDLLADLADATAMMQGEKLAGRPMELVAEALKSDPKHQKSLALAATAAMQAGERDNAVKLWRALQSQFLPASPDYQQIGNILAQLGEQPPAGAPEPAASGPTTGARPQAASPADPSAVVRGQVALSPAALQQLKKQPLPDAAVLFILAKAVDGPPMPLAVLRLPVADLVAGRMLPFQLDDTQAMSPQLQLSKFRQVSVEARISMNGNAIRQPGDWSAAKSPVTVGKEAVPLQIEPAPAR